MQDPLQVRDARAQLIYFLPYSGLGLLLVSSTAVLIFESRPIEFLAPGNSGMVQWSGYLLVVILMIGLIGFRSWVDRIREPGAYWLSGLFVLIAAAMTLCHVMMIDRYRANATAQVNLYLSILNHTSEPPHQYRAMPYGFVRMLELFTRNVVFSCLAYRWFFNFWFVWAWYAFARKFLSRGHSLLTLMLLAIYYPLSIRWYMGQLTDPMNHTLFILGMLYTIQNRWALLLATLVVGIGSKETIALLVPVYLACHIAQGRVTVQRSLVLGAACVLSFLLFRLPLGWQPGGIASMNGVSGLMFNSNLGLYDLGIGQPAAVSSVPIFENYAHVLLFTIPFLPSIFAQWRQFDPRLRNMFLVFVPLMLITNAAFGWLYESRNYMPMLVLLAVMAMPRLSDRMNAESGTI